MVTFRDANNLMSDREDKILIFGNAKMGKTHLSLSVVNYLKNKGYKPEDILIGFIDADDGVAPLLKKGIIDTEYNKSIMYAYVENFDDVVDATNEIIKACKEHIKSHPRETAWIIVDNIQKVWEMVRDKYAQEMYGKTLFDLMKQKKAEARMEGKKMLPTFDMRTDYAIINPMHSSWLMSINNSRINYILTAPENSQEDAQTHSITVSPRGQKDVKYSVDTMIYVYMNGQTHIAEVGGRLVSSPISIKNPSIEAIKKKIEG